MLKASFEAKVMHTTEQCDSCLNMLLSSNFMDIDYQRVSYIHMVNVMNITPDTKSVLVSRTNLSDVASASPHPDYHMASFHVVNVMNIHEPVDCISHQSVPARSWHQLATYHGGMCLLVVCCKSNVHHICSSTKYWLFPNIIEAPNGRRGHQLLLAKVWMPIGRLGIFHLNFAQLFLSACSLTKLCFVKRCQTL